MPWFSDIVEGKRKFLSKVNHRFGLKPGVSVVTTATILLQKKALLPQKQWGTKELCILRGKSLSYRKDRWMIWVILSLENFYFLRKGYLAAAPLILHTKEKRLASLPNKGMVRFYKKIILRSFSTKADYQYSRFTNWTFTWLLLCTTKVLVNNILLCLSKKITKRSLKFEPRPKCWMC